MGTISSYLSNALLDHIFNNIAYIPPTTLYLGISSQNPTKDGSGAIESLVRQAITFGSASGRRTTQNADVTFAANWSDGSYWMVFDALTGGNMLAYGMVGNAPPTITAGSIYIEFLSGTITDYLANALLNLVFTNTAFASPDTYVLLALSDISDSDTTATEPAVGGYARVRVNPSGGVSPTWKLDEVISNLDEIVFPTATASWGTITSVGIADAATAGNLLFYSNALVDQLIDSNDIFRFLAGDFVVRIDPTDVVDLDLWTRETLPVTYVDASSFSVPGDLTSVYTPRRAIKASTTVGAINSHVLSSAFALGATTVTIAGAVLDSGLSSLYYGQSPKSDPSTELSNDLSPQLGGDLDLNGHNIDFPSKAISDVLDEDDMVSDSDTAVATQQSVKAYVDAHKTNHVVSDWHHGNTGYSTSSASYVDVASEFNISVTLGAGKYTVMAQAVLHKVDMANNGYTADFKLSCGGVTDYSTRNNGGGDTDSDIALHTIASGVSGTAEISLQWRVPGGSSVSCAYVTVSILAIREE